ncbi:SAM-dependent methyltransferase [Streptomyces sp. NPDC059740]|uniref:SAM-dependent methyltransferase n=1 Tax=Streptomyces sp. NPDC059740 TaxID=3346926 RepID=UPI00364B53EF
MIEKVDSPPLGPNVYPSALAEDFATRYAEGRDSWTGEPAMQHAVQDLIGVLADRPGQHVLDVGTGHGRDALVLLRAGHRVTGIDLLRSPQWDEVSAAGEDRARFLTTDLLNLPEDTVYDAVLDNGCMHHQHPDLYGAYIERLWRVLRPGGTLLVSVFGAREAQGATYLSNDRRLCREFTEAELGDVFGQHGFTLSSCRSVPRDLPGRHYLLATFSRDEALA